MAATLEALRKKLHDDLKSMHTGFDHGSPQGDATAYTIYAKMREGQARAAQYTHAAQPADVVRMNVPDAVTYVKGADGAYHAP